jgi:RNA polymerase sigma-70 factor (ECF subfamily)
MDEAILAGALSRAREGDPGAFGEIYEAFAGRVLGLCRRLLRSPEEAEDAASEVFLKAHQAMESYDRQRPFANWLLSIASHHCVDRLRRRGVERRLFEAVPVEEREPAGGGPGPLGRYVSAEESATVRRAVEALPESYRVPLVLRYYGDMGYEEIATALGLTRGNVAVLLHRARKKLREALAPQGQETVQ